jgi:hypothetical protein
MSAFPASELVAAGLQATIASWITAAFGDGRVVVRGAQSNLSTLQPEQTPAVAMWATTRMFVDPSENVPNTVLHDFTIQGLARVTSADDPALVETLLNQLVDVLDQLWTTTVLGNVGCTINPNGTASMTWPGTGHGIVQFDISIRYERMAQP